ncbi:PREDICTED: uncharacterized protein LOC104737890 [Camelina sativa]|uniref:Uncharacterized protein LOC104737890 n=1 Tax=Camelina sativa TaxID=90675 RepID=A0ABM1QTB0_CAMSA|nr:PREDICTED: uncharacterized protein LOC104737890 [Camelina sativa]
MRRIRPLSFTYATGTSAGKDHIREEVVRLGVELSVSVAESMFLLCDDIHTMLWFCFKLWKYTLPPSSPVSERLLRVFHYVYSKDIKPKNRGFCCPDGGNSVHWEFVKTTWKDFTDGVIVLDRLVLLLRKKDCSFDDRLLSSAVENYKQQVLKKLEDKLLFAKDVSELNGFAREIVASNVSDLWKSLFDEEEEAGEPSPEVTRNRIISDLFQPILGDSCHCEITTLPVTSPYILGSEFAMQGIREEVVQLGVELSLCVAESMFLLSDEIRSVLQFCLKLWRSVRRFRKTGSPVGERLLRVMHHVYSRNIKPKNGVYHSGYKSVHWDLIRTTWEDFVAGIRDLHNLFMRLEVNGTSLSVSVAESMFLLCDDIHTMLWFCFKLWKYTLPPSSPVSERLLRVFHYVYSKDIKPKNRGFCCPDGGNSVHWEFVKTTWKDFTDGVIVLDRLVLLLRKKDCSFDDRLLSSAVENYKQQVLKKLEDKLLFAKDVSELNGFAREIVASNVSDLWKSLFDEEEEAGEPSPEVTRNRIISDLFQPILGDSCHCEITTLPVTSPYILGSEFAMQGIREEVVQLGVELSLCVAESMFLLSDEIRSVLQFCLKLWRSVRRFRKTGSPVGERLLRVMHHVYSRNIKPKNGVYHSGYKSVHWDLIRTTWEDFVAGIRDLHNLFMRLEVNGTSGIREEVVQLGVELSLCVAESMFLLCDEIWSVLQFCLKLWKSVRRFRKTGSPVGERLLRVMHHVYSRNIKPKNGVYHSGYKSVHWDLIRTTWEDFVAGIRDLHNLFMRLEVNGTSAGGREYTSRVKELLKKVKEKLRCAKDVLEANGFAMEAMESNILGLWKSLFNRVTEEAWARNAMRREIIMDLFQPLLKETEEAKQH